MSKKWWLGWVRGGGLARHEASATRCAVFPQEKIIFRGSENLSGFLIFQAVRADFQSG